MAIILALWYICNQVSVLVARIEAVAARVSKWDVGDWKLKILFFSSEEMAFLFGLWFKMLRFVQTPKKTDHPGELESNVDEHIQGKKRRSLLALFGISDTFKRFPHAGNEHVYQHNGDCKSGNERTHFHDDVFFALLKTVSKNMLEVCKQHFPKL